MLEPSKSDQVSSSAKPPTQGRRTSRSARVPARGSARETQVHGLAAARKNPGITGGKVTFEDFASAEGVTEEDAKVAGTNIEAMNKMTLAEMQAYVGKPSKPIQVRSPKEVLAAIQSKVMPRWVARVGPKFDFDRYEGFGYPDANQLFATEPCDVVGLGAAEALVKVGWTAEQLEKKVGQEIELCVFDTSKAVARCAPEANGEKEGEGKGEARQSASLQVGEMNWKTLEAVAMDESKNQYFLKDILKKEPYSNPVTKQDAYLCKDDLPELFALASRLPAEAKPDTQDALLGVKYAAFRKALGEGMSASKLFSGMGATINEKGALGCREVMVSKFESLFAFTPDNHVRTSLGTLEETELNQLIKG